MILAAPISPGTIAILACLAALALMVLRLWLRRRSARQDGPTAAPVSPAREPGLDFANPDWADNFTDEGRSLFLERLGEYFQRRNLRVEINAAGGAVKFLDSHTQGPANLINIAQICAQTEPETWDAAIADHFGKLESLAARAEGFDEQSRDFEQVRGLIHVRLLEKGSYGNLKAVARDALPGTEMILVYDFDDSTRGLSPEELGPWGKSQDELFRIGFENVRENYPITTETIRSDRARLLVAEANHFYVATHALLIEYHPELIGERGAIVAIPVPGMLISHPIKDSTMLDAIELMLRAARDFYRQGPRSISPEIFWYHDGQFTALPCRQEGDKILFEPTEDFSALLSELAGDRLN